MFLLTNQSYTNKLIRFAPFFLITMLFFFLNYQFIGPAYISDEIGYLTKAAGLAGYTIDRPSKWYAGYSLLLAPLFYIISDPMSLWKAIMLLNAAIWGVNFYFLSKILLILFPHASKKEHCLTMLLAIAYPAWALMSGHTFPTTLFSCLFTLGLFSLLNLRLAGRYILILSVCCGYLGWIHPLGYCVIIAAAIAIAVSSEIDRFKNISVFISITAIMLLIYHQVIDVWLTDALTSKHGLRTMQSDYYASRMPERFLGAFINWEFWKRFWLAYFGQLSYTIVASFGAAAVGAKYLWDAAKQNKHRPEFCYVILTFLFVLSSGVLYFASGTRVSNHYWIYGRYTEMVLLPLITIGFMSIKQIKTQYIMLISVFVFIVGCLLYLSLDNESSVFNYANVQSFWPFIFIGYSDFFSLFLVGAAGIVVAYVAFRFNHYTLLGVVLVTYLFAHQRYSTYHETLLSERSNRYPAFLNLVAENFNENTCVIFDFESRSIQPSYFRNIMWVIYTYYLYDYRYARATPEYWYENCSGPIFTFNPEMLSHKSDIITAAWDKTNDLFFVVKQDDLRSIKYTKVREGTHKSVSLDADCKKNICLNMNAKQLAQFTAVGELQKGTLNSTSRNGYLLLGPYISLNAGFYALMLDINFASKDCIDVSITSNNGKNLIYEGKLCPDSLASIPFDLYENSDDFEIKLLVRSEDIVSVKNYKIVKRDKSGMNH